MEIIYKSNSVILHGSPHQNLDKVNPTNARYNGKVFGTYNFQRALRYIASMENGGDSVLSKNGKLYVLNTNPNLLLEEKGSVYLVSNSTFVADSHKGEEYDWIYSSTEELEVTAEIQFDNVLEIWDVHGVIAVSSEMTTKLLNVADEDTLSKCIEINERLLSTRNLT